MHERRVGRAAAVGCLRGVSHQHLFNRETLRGVLLKHASQKIPKFFGDFHVGWQRELLRADAIKQPLQRLRVERRDPEDQHLTKRRQKKPPSLLNAAPGKASWSLPETTSDRREPKETSRRLRTNECRDAQRPDVGSAAVVSSVYLGFFQHAQTLRRHEGVRALRNAETRPKVGQPRRCVQPKSLSWVLADLLSCALHDPPHREPPRSQSRRRRLCRLRPEAGCLV